MKKAFSLALLATLASSCVPPQAITLGPITRYADAQGFVTFNGVRVHASYTVEVIDVDRNISAWTSADGDTGQFSTPMPLGDHFKARVIGLLPGWTSPYTVLVSVRRNPLQVPVEIHAPE